MNRKYQNLVVWQKAMSLVKDIYSITAGFPECEKFGLTSQMRRAAVSVPSNIAEGSGRGTDKDFRRFLLHARGSLTELDTQLILAESLGLASYEPCVREQVEHVFALLNGLINRLGN
ncbi:four helix bundle protein [Oceanobacter kriegii]|uniref:four helix bundle protein n=1 Tax=Oceanobacter kriegii TaxID=64972 RepID=UPI0004037AF2|nr:four helix bundle protein [Oceanobacter kriegii]